MTIQLKAIEQCFHVVLFTTLYKVVLTFKSADQAPVCDHSNENYWAVQSRGTVCSAVQGGSKLTLSLWMKPHWVIIQWKLLSNPFIWYCLQWNLDVTRGPRVWQKMFAVARFLSMHFSITGTKNIVFTLSTKIEVPLWKEWLHKQESKIIHQKYNCMIFL